jgi:electron transfer flavoprotein alpha subunit
MAVLIVTETSKGKFNKASIEAISYGAQVARQLSTTASVLSIGAGSDDELAKAGEYGVGSVLKADSAKLAHFDAQLFSKLVIAAMEKSGADVLIMSHNTTGKAVAPRVSAILQAGVVSGAVALPNTSGEFSIRKNVFSGKAFAEYSISTAKKIITLLPNSVPVQVTGGSATVSAFNEVADAFQSVLKVEERIHQTDGEIPLPGAELVVSAGRGMKGPENWGMIEDLAKILGAATACSRPVADIGWRPHHEHVGQTGIAIRPNLYIAVGISGAIQHLAGVNGSKVIVVINKDSEAPFFKAADYGVVGDAFEIVPKLNEAFRKFKAQNA